MAEEVLIQHGSAADAAYTTAATPLPVVVDSTSTTPLLVDAKDIVSRDLLQSILVELRVMNTHLTIVSGEDVTRNDVQEY